MSGLRIEQQVPGIRWRDRAAMPNGRRRRALLVTVGVVCSFLTLGSPLRASADAPSPAVDTGSLSAISRMTGAQAMWETGFFGQGIGVAVIDTGVARVSGLDAPGKVIDGPDLSFDSQDPELAYIDAFGHGTHVAGIIAGSDVAPGTSNKRCKTCLGESAYSDTTKFVGIAPQAKIINVKVGAYDGAVDVSQMIAAINWVVQHRSDPGLNIRVLNLSFGTDSLQSAQIDPLAFAVEAAWNAGIVVVVSAGNDGETTGGLANPAYSPTVIAVGSTDPRGTLSVRDDRVASFAQHGTEQRPVDVAVPGVSVTSLAVPGSFIDQNVTTGKVGTRFQRASGTSQSAAVVSGLVALMLSKFPTATPDAVKAYLTAAAVEIDDDGDNADLRDDNDDHFKGAGSANVALVARTGISAGSAWMNTVRPIPSTGTGLGTLEAARGSYHVLIDDVPLVGEVDIFGNEFDAASIAEAARNGTSWTGGVWNDAQWIGDDWSVDGARWTSYTWTETDWTGARWSGARWTDATWDGARWSGARWSGARWSAGEWS